jgi:hypothetical protein
MRAGPWFREFLLGYGSLMAATMTQAQGSIRVSAVNEPAVEARKWAAETVGCYNLKAGLKLEF